MNQAYRGSCHCGRVTFELQGEVKYVIDCRRSMAASSLAKTWQRMAPRVSTATRG
jgi:hypothetical protein